LTESLNDFTKYTNNIPLKQQANEQNEPNNDLPFPMLTPFC